MSGIEDWLGGSDAMKKILKDMKAHSREEEEDPEMKERIAKERSKVEKIEEFIVEMYGESVKIFAVIETDTGIHQLVHGMSPITLLGIVEFIKKKASSMFGVD